MGHDDDPVHSDSKVMSVLNAALIKAGGSDLFVRAAGRGGAILVLLLFLSMDLFVASINRISVADNILLMGLLCKGHIESNSINYYKLIL